MKLGVLGGTFDPPHVGHLILAELAREQLGLDRVRFIPAGDPWRKSGKGVTAAADRLAMTRLAVAGNAAFEVDDCEVRREGPSYTSVTLATIRSVLAPADELFFLVGEDALADLPHWHDPAAIARAAVVAVAARDGAALPAALPFGEERLVRVAMPVVDVSSTELRERARRGSSLRYFVPAAVEAYIHEQGLYR